MHPFVFILASVPSLAMARPHTFGQSTPSIVPLPSETKAVPRDVETSPCPTTTAAAGLLGILRRAAPILSQHSQLPSFSEDVKMPEETQAAPSDLHARNPGLLGLPLLGKGTTSKAPTTAHATSVPDSSISAAANTTEAVHDSHPTANSTTAVTSYPSPKVTKTDFPFDSAAVNGIHSSTSASSATASATLDARAENSTASTNKTAGLDTDSNYYCAVVYKAYNESIPSNTTSAAGTEAASSSNTTVTMLQTAYTCYSTTHHSNSTASATQTGTASEAATTSATAHEAANNTATITTISTATRRAKQSDAEITGTITDTFVKTSLEKAPSTTTATTPTTSAGLLDGVLGGL